MPLQFLFLFYYSMGLLKRRYRIKWIEIIGHRKEQIAKYRTVGLISLVGVFGLLCFTGFIQAPSEGENAPFAPGRDFPLYMK